MRQLKYAILNFIIFIKRVKTTSRLSHYPATTQRCTRRRNYTRKCGHANLRQHVRLFRAGQRCCGPAQIKYSLRRRSPQWLYFSLFLSLIKINKNYNRIIQIYRHINIHRRKLNHEHVHYIKNCTVLRGAVCHTLHLAALHRVGARESRDTRTWPHSCAEKRRRQYVVRCVFSIQTETLRYKVAWCLNISWLGRLSYCGFLWHISFEFDKIFRTTFHIPRLGMIIFLCSLFELINQFYNCFVCVICIHEPNFYRVRHNQPQQKLRPPYKARFVESRNYTSQLLNNKNELIWTISILRHFSSSLNIEHYTIAAGGLGYKKDEWTDIWQLTDRIVGSVTLNCHGHRQFRNATTFISIRRCLCLSSSHRNV